jgi:hypothetical protein
VVGFGEACRIAKEELEVRSERFLTTLFLPCANDDLLLHAWLSEVP